MPGIAKLAWPMSGSAAIHRLLSKAESGRFPDSRNTILTDDLSSTIWKKV
jgi:hypothetical protein